MKTSVFILLSLLGSYYAEERLSYAIPAGTSKAYLIGRGVGHVRSVPVSSLTTRADKPEVVVTSLNTTEGTHGVFITSVGNNSATYTFTHVGNNSQTTGTGGIFVSNNTSGSFGSVSSSSTGTFPGTSVLFPTFQGQPVLHPVFRPPKPSNVVFRSFVRPGEAKRVLALPPPYPQFFYNADNLQLTTRRNEFPPLPFLQPPLSFPQPPNVSPLNPLASRFGFGLFPIVPQVFPF